MSSPAPAPPFEPPPSVLRLAAFRLFWSARVLSTMAFQLQGVAVGWQMYALTHSALALGFVGLVQFLPMLCLTLVVGHVADRYDRRRIAAICQLVGGSATTLLAIGSFAGWLTPPVIFAAVAVIGAGARLRDAEPAGSVCPGWCRRRCFPRATAYSASAIQTATIIGPAIGGLAYVFGPEVPYACAALLSLSACLLTSRIRLEHTPRAREPVSLSSHLLRLRLHPQPSRRARQHLARSLRRAAGRRHRFAAGLMPATFCIPAPGGWACCARLRRSARSACRSGLPTIRCAGTSGSPCSARSSSSAWRRSCSRLSHWLWLSTFAMVVLGASDVISVVVRSSFVQLSTPDHMRGRVTAVNSLFIGTSNQLGEFESGVTATLFGTVPAVVLGGVGTIVVALLWMRLFPALRNADTLESVARDAGAGTAP